MTKSDKSFAALRREIDEIDAAMHDLLMRRTEVVEKIGVIKSDGGDGIYLRPAREALILRELANRHRGKFPIPNLVRIWREMTATLVGLQGPFSVAVHTGDGVPGQWDLARDHFGSHTPMTAYGSPGQVIRAVMIGKATVGVLSPLDDAEPRPWWPLLASEDNEIPRIIARLPFAAAGNARGDQPRALAVARIDQESTGGDRTFLVLEGAVEISRSRLKEATGEAGLAANFFAVHQSDRAPQDWLHLMEIETFVGAGDPRLDRLRQIVGRPVKNILNLGGFANPLDLGEAGAD